jgi:hypothetical protein
MASSGDAALYSALNVRRRGGVAGSSATPTSWARSNGDALVMVIVLHVPVVALEETSPTADVSPQPDSRGYGRTCQANSERMAAEG